MGEHLITTGGRTYRVTAGEDDTADVDAIVAWLCESYGQPAASVAALSRQQVLARIGCSAIPAGFPEPDVVIGDAGRESGGYTRGWLAATVQAWQEARIEADAAAQAVSEPAEPAAGETEPGGADTDAWTMGARRWTGVGDKADKWVHILTSRGAVKPSGVVSAHKPLDAQWLGRYVWKHWKHKPQRTPQLWITAQALAAAGMSPPKRPPASSADLSDAVAKVFGCEVTTAKAGWFTAVFRAPDDAAAGGGEARRVHLVLLPFLWLDPASQRPSDRGMAGTVGTPTELPDDEDAAVAILAERIAWLSEFHGECLLPAARPASVGASLLDAVRRDSRTHRRIEACPVPDTVIAETPRLDPDLENWKNMPHTAKGDTVDVEVDQRAAFLASAGLVELGYGVPVERPKADPAAFAEKHPPFGLWRVTTPPGASLDGLSRRLPLPHGHMTWEAPATFWATTRAVQHLLAPVDDGGAGLSVPELDISGAWVWPQKSRQLLRPWAELLRGKLVEAQTADRQDRIDIIKNIYKAFLGRMAGSKHPPGQRHYQQPVWAATIHADTRWRALRYATRTASTHGLYPIAARDIDTFVYRVPADLDPAVLTEDSDANGKYRVKHIRTRESG